MSVEVPPPRTGVINPLRARLGAEGVDALVVTVPANVRYLSGFTSPEDGAVVVTQTEAVLVTDGRYTAQAQAESPLETIITRQLGETVASLVPSGTIAIETDQMPVQRYDQLAQVWGRVPHKTAGLVAGFREHKNDSELAALREAARITDEAFEHILDRFEAGRIERDLALELERFMVTHGAEAASFGIVVASGPRSAMPHGLASSRAIQEGDLVTLDFGAKVHGYHADMTRTVALGEPSDEHRQLYEAVQAAEALALAAVGPGASGKALDTLARDALEERGLAQHFTHVLGHGVGLAIHEAPRLAQTSGDVLEPGMVVTIEPGVYRPGDAGVRIEDLVAVTADGHELLSHSPKDLLLL